MGILLAPGREEHRTPPAGVADAVEMWARSNGTHARPIWHAGMAAWCIEIDLKPDDPRMRAYQAGKAHGKPCELVPLLEQTKRDPRTGTPIGKPEGIDIEQLGPSGVVSLLEQGSVLTGRGQYRNLMEAVRAVRERNAATQERIKREAMERSADRTRDQRRQVLDLPLVSVPDTIQ